MAGVPKKILESYGIAATVKMTSTVRVVVALLMVIVVDESVKIGSIVVKFVIEMETANRMFALNRDVLNEIRSYWGDHARVLKIETVRAELVIRVTVYVEPEEARLGIS